MAGQQTATEDDGLALADLPVADRRDDAWRMLREHGGSVQIEDGIAATSLAVVEAVLKEPNQFSSKEAFDVLGSPIPLVPIAFDPPDQTRYRRVLQPFFSPRRIRPLEESLRAQVVELVEAARAKGSCDFVADVAVPFPVQTFLTLFGLPLEDRDKFIAWKDAIIGLTDPSGVADLQAEAQSAGMEQAAALAGYLWEVIQVRREEPGDDILSEVLALEGDDRLSDEEAMGLCFLFVLAGLETVTDSLGFGMERLAQHPERRRELVEDPSLVPAAIEELLRLDPPAPFLPRVTTSETELDGRTLPAGTRVTAYLTTANRDEDRCPHAYDVDFHRPENPHASFGVGVHRCLGSHLARLEMRLVYEEWHRRIPEYSIVEGSEHRVTWPRGTIGLESLHLEYPEAT